VTRLRDGQSFTSRSVNAFQNGKIMFSLMASFHRPEVGVCEIISFLHNFGIDEDDSNQLSNLPCVVLWKYRNNILVCCFNSRCQL
jgi:hypothetical protein